MAAPPRKRARHELVYQGDIQSKKIKNSCSFDEGQEEKRKKSFSLWYKGGKGKKDPHKRSIKVKDNDSKKHPSTRSKDEVNSCKVILPDGCTITVTFQPGQTLQSVVENVCHERNLPLSSLEVLQLGCDKPLDMTLGASSFDSKEIVLERRVLFRMDLPNKKYLGVKAKPTRSIAEVFQPILLKYDLKLDGVVLHLAGSSSPVDTNAQISTVENQRIMVQSCDDYAEWGGFDLMTKQNTPAVCHQQDYHPKPSDSLEAITNKVFEDLFDFNEPTVFDELGVMDFATKNEEKRRYSTNSNNNSKNPGLFMFSRRRSSLDKYPRPKNRSRLSLPSSQKHLPNKMAAMKIKDPDDDRFFDLLSKVQSKRIDDQRGLSDKYELPEFLKTDHFRLSQRSTSTGDLSEAVLSIANLNKSFSQPEGLDDSSCRRTTPTPDLSFMNAGLDHSYILPSHDEADLLFSQGEIISPDFTDPNLTKKSIRDIGFDNKQSCHHVSTPIEFLNVSYQSTPCLRNGKRLSARARSNSPFNEKNRSVIDMNSTVSPNNLDSIDLDRTLTENDCASQSFNVCRNSVATDEMKTTVNLPLNSYAGKNHPSTVQTTRRRSSPLNLQFVSADERPMSCPPNSSSLQTVIHRKPPSVPEKPNRLQLKASSVGIVPKLTNAEDLNSDHSNISLCSLDDLPSPSTHELIPPLSDNTSFQQSLLSQKDVKVTFV